MSAKGLLLTAMMLLGTCVLIASCGSDTVAPSVDEAPILPPQNVTVSATAVGHVIVSWDRNTQTHLKGYNVYRLDVASSGIQKLTADPIALNIYEDESAGLREYEYRVTSVSVRGNESGFSSATIQIEDSQSKDKRDPQT